MKRIINLKLFGITATAFIIIWLLTFIPVNLGFINPFKNALYDFDVNDLVFSKFSYDKNADTNIVIVNIGYLNRPQLAKLITKVKSFKPRVVGLDILFREYKEPIGDSLLENAIKLDGNTVIVNKLSDYNQISKSYDTLITSINEINNIAFHGYANLPSKDGSNFTTIRMFKPGIIYRESSGGDSMEHPFPGGRIPAGKDISINAFAAAVVKLYDKDSFDYLIKRNNEFETINYRGNADKFYYVDGAAPENLNNLNFIKGKIVLFGFLGDYPSNRILEDIFYTPLNENYAGKSYPDMYGVVIHANIISMILNKDYINSFPAWVEILLAFIICFFNVLLINFIKRQKIDWLSLISLTTKTAEFVLILFLEMEILLNYRLKISITLILASIVLISDAEAIYDIIFDKIKSLITKKIQE